MGKIILKSNSERDFRWPELEITAGDTVEIYKEQMERIPVLQKLIKAGELEVVGAKGEPDKKEESEESEDTNEEVKEVLKNIKNKKK